MLYKYEINNIVAAIALIYSEIASRNARVGKNKLKASHL